MPKFLTNIFGNKATPTKESAKEPSTEIAASISNGNLETDALPVDDDDSGSIHQSPSSNASPTASAEMTADAVRQFSDPNYNSMVEARRAHGSEGAVGGGELVQAPLANGVCVAQNSNTMNVHNAQQQVVMNFSNVSQLHFGSVYNINGSRKTSFAEESTPPSMAAAGTKSEKEGKAGGNTKCRKTTTVLAMMQSQEEPNHRLLETIATHLGEGWRSVMRELGHSDGQIEQAVIDHHMHGGMKEVIYQLLLKWVHNADDGEATVARITTLLWSMNHRECVQRMKVVWKSSR